MDFDLWHLYRHMYRSRLFEEAIERLWQNGDISGELHLGIGEEAIAAGIVTQMSEGDALALDHRGTPPLIMRGIDPASILKELLGKQDGLCGGLGGHMHLLSRDHLAVSSGMVGASGPAAAGFALAARYLRPGTIAIAFFGEGAANQGMLLETMNLAGVWKLPVLFICKDNEWAITTHSPQFTSGNLVERARGFGIHAQEVDGRNVEAVWKASKIAIERARNGRGPTFLHARHIQHQPGHMVSMPFTRVTRQPLKALTPIVLPMMRSFLRVKGAPLRQRVDSLLDILKLLASSHKAHSSKDYDPVWLTRQRLGRDLSHLTDLERDARIEIKKAVETALSP
jgi:pyruvate dehydrogenase E1 component alpha subunit